MPTQVHRVVRDIPTAQREALYKLERNPEGCTLHGNVVQALQRRSLIVPVCRQTWKMSPRGERFMAMMNDPSLTAAQVMTHY